MEKIEIVDALLAALGRGERAELVMVIGTFGSSPRSAGAWMAVFGDGTTAGTVGGGRVEELARQEALGLLGAQASATTRHALGGKSSDTGMICGGAIDLCYLLIDASQADVLGEVRQVLAERGKGTLRVDLSGVGYPDDACVGADVAGRSHAGTLPMSVEDETSQRAVAGMDGASYRETLCPEGLTYIFGCGHVGRSLAGVLAAAGFAVVACDDRPEMLGTDLLPAAMDRRLVDYGDLAATCAIGPRDLVVCATSGHASDYEVVSQALAAHPSYLGCLGSKRKTAFMRGKLMEAGFTPEQTDAVHMPVGLEIHAETPEEIAVSIAAQMICHRRTCLMPRA